MLEPDNNADFANELNLSYNRFDVLDNAQELGNIINLLKKDASASCLSIDTRTVQSIMGKQIISKVAGQDCNSGKVIK